MDVLELPRPVINFLRTMAKESCRYALSWDIFGGPDSVTLTLTWKLIDDESQSSIINEATSPSSLKQSQNYDETHTRIRSTVKNSNSTSSPRRSRRDDHTSTNENASVPAIFRSSRGKSLEDPSIQSNKQMTTYHHHHRHPHPHPHTKEPQHVASLERPTIPNHYHHRTKKEQQKQLSTQSDQIYGHLYDTRTPSVVKCATISSLSSSSPSPQPSNNPPLPIAYTHQQRTKQPQQSVTPPTLRKSIRPLVNISRTPTRPVTSNTSSSNYAKLKRTDNVAIHDDMDDDDDALDPWVKRFECSLEDNDDDDAATEQSEEKELIPPSTIAASMDDSANTSGKVKFKTKPDYF